VPDVLAVALAGAVTALATGLGAVPVFFVGARAAALRPVLWGLAAGVMAVASWQGLLVPALREGTPAAVAGGLMAGIAFLAVTRRLVQRHEARGVFSVAHARALLVVIVLGVHSLPEGFAIGTAWGSEVEGLGLFVVLAIALQNVPEGTVTAIPMAEDGASRTAQFWTAVLTSVPQPIGAVAAYLLVETVEELLPVSFAFAAGAMLALTVSDLLPEALRGPGRAAGLAGIAGGAAVMAVMAAVLRV
jgi:ZIP family zinc transporter